MGVWSKIKYYYSRLTSKPSYEIDVGTAAARTSVGKTYREYAATSPIGGMGGGGSVTQRRGESQATYQARIEAQRIAQAKIQKELERLKQQRLAQIKLRQAQLARQTQKALRGKTPSRKQLQAEADERRRKIYANRPTQETRSVAQRALGDVKRAEQFGMQGLTGQDVKDVREGRTTFEEIRDKRKEEKFSVFKKVDEVKINSTYDPRTQTFITPSPTGFGATGYMKQPTIEEQKIIEVAQKRGGGDFTPSQALYLGEKVVTPVLEYKLIKATTSFIRDIPVIRKEDPMAVLTGGKELTIGGLALGTVKKAEDFIQLSKKSWGDISLQSREFGKTERGQKWGGGIWTGIGYSAKGVEKIILPVTKPIVQYTTLTLAGGAALDLMAIEQKKKEPEKYIQAQLDIGFKQYKKDYTKAEKELKEGYGLEPALTKTEFTKEYGKEIKAQTLSGIRGESVVPFLLLTGAGVAKGIKYLKSPKIVKGSEIRGKQFRLRYLEEQSPKVTEKGITIGARYKLMDIKTPTTAYTQTPLGRIIGRDPKLVVLSKGQTYVTQPTANLLGKPAYVGKPYFARTGRVGVSGKLVNIRFGIVEGTQKGTVGETLSKTIQKVPKSEQYLLKSLIEKTETGGRPISYKAISKYVPEEALLSTGEVTQIGLPRKYAGVDVLKIDIAKTATITKPIKTFESGIQTFKVKTVFKQVGIKPSRATGKVDLMEGVVIRHPLQVIDDVGAGVRSFIGRGKKPSAQFLQQLYQTQKVTPITKPIIKITPPKTSITPPTPSPITTTEIPRMVGGLGVTILPYAGIGMYEVTEGVGMMEAPKTITGMTIPPMILKIKVKEPSIRQEYLFKEKALLKEKQLLIQKLSQKELQVLKPLTKVQSMIKEKALLKAKQLTKQAVIQKALQKQLQKQLTKQILLTKLKTLRQIPIQPSLTIPKIPTLDISKTLKKAKKIVTDKEKFKVFVTKFGKEIEIGEFQTLTEAKSSLVKRLRGTLRAGAYITKDKKKIKARTLGLFGVEFRPSKKDPFKVIERKTRRIKRGTGEIGEILSFRKSKTSKKKLSKL